MMSESEKGDGTKGRRRREEDEREETPWLQPSRRQNPVANQSTPIPGTHPAGNAAPRPLSPFPTR